MALCRECNGVFFFVPLVDGPQRGLQRPAESAGEAELCPICQERVGQNGRAVACPFCDVAFCFRCARDLLDSGRPGELDEQGYPVPLPCCPNCRGQVRDEAGWLAHPQHPAENLAFRDVFAGYRPLRLGVARLRAENERLQEQAQAAEELRAQNERLRAEVAALSRQLGGLVVEDDGEEQVGPPVAAGEQVAEAAVPAVAGAVEAPVVARRGGPINDGQQPGPSGLVAPGQVAVRRGGPIEDGQRPGPSGVVALPLATGRRRVPSRFRDASGVFVCPECGYRTPHRGHADDHFSRHAGSDVHAAWTMEQQERRGRPVGGGGPHRRQRRRHRVRGTMAFEFEEEEEIEYED
ncbi:hypothetical protein AAVH_27310 [Aphelenchoides avenae]|nr:hypothetical protein AAVH_27310 [Aphelenchus avenae]